MKTCNGSGEKYSRFFRSLFHRHKWELLGVYVDPFAGPFAKPTVKERCSRCKAIRLTVGKRTIKQIEP